MVSTASLSLQNSYTNHHICVCAWATRTRVQIGSHVHSIVGASRFKNVYDADDLMQSKCTTIPVQPDKSNYWAVRPRISHGSNAKVGANPTSDMTAYALPPRPADRSARPDA